MDMLDNGRGAHQASKLHDEGLKQARKIQTCQADQVDQSNEITIYATSYLRHSEAIYVQSFIHRGGVACYKKKQDRNPSS